MVEIQGGQYPDEVGECFDNIIRDDFNPDSILDDIDLLYDEASINGYRKGMEHGAIIAAALSIAGFVAGWFGTTFGVKIYEKINKKKLEKERKKKWNENLKKALEIQEELDNEYKD